MCADDGEGVELVEVGCIDFYEIPNLCSAMVYGAVAARVIRVLNIESFLRNRYVGIVSKFIL